MSEHHQTGPAHAGPVAARRLRGPSKALVLSAWLAAPIVVVALLCLAIWLSFADPPEKQPPVGAGAGDAGGANAVGQMLDDDTSDDETPKAEAP